jgi:hypothetical protein
VITNIWCTVVAKFCEDFVASMHSNFFQGLTDRGLIYGPNHSNENLLSKQEREEENIIQLMFDLKPSIKTKGV